MQTLTDCLYSISSTLLAPVVIGLLILLAWTICLLGGFVREWFERKRVRLQFKSSLDIASRGGPSQAICKAMDSSGNGLPARFALLARNTPGDDKSLSNILAVLEHEIAASIARHSFITRVGPMLGLMGTLIPLGPALTGLAGGNMQVMASHLVVAFTTTVVGVFISVVAFGMALVRRTWYARDFTDLEVLCQTITRKGA